MYSYRSEKRAVGYIVLQRCSHLISGLSKTRLTAVHHPDLGLEGAPRDRFELYQEHIIKLHKALTNLPLSVSGPVYSVRAL